MLAFCVSVINLRGRDAQAVEFEISEPVTRHSPSRTLQTPPAAAAPNLQPPD